MLLFCRSIVVCVKLVIGKECTFLPQSHGGLWGGSAGRRGFFFQTWSYCIISGFRELYRDGILGHQSNKRLAILLYAIHSPFYRCILKKTILFSGFKNPYKKNFENRKLESIHD
jgi:hypothetical protein